MKIETALRWAAVFLALSSAAGGQTFDPVFHELHDGSGHAVEEEKFAGKFRIVSFGFMHCPDVCPVTLSALHLALDQLGPDAERVRAVFVSVDPKRDAPAQLNDFVKQFDPRIVALTGESPALRQVAANYEIDYFVDRQDTADIYGVAHTTRLSLIAPSGRIVAGISTEQSPQRIAAEVVEKLKSDTDWRE